MASASTSYGLGKDGYAYDVFINARVPDVKKRLASHLYESLRRHGLRVFLDSDELQAGQHISAQKEGAIKTASLHLAIFSPHYAESRGCLDELVLMLETRKTIIPVFYNVNPSELRWVRSGDGLYAQSLRAFDSQPRHDPHTTEKWTNALKYVAVISGFNLKAYNGDEGLLVEEVVKQVLRKVAKPPLFIAKYPTGLDNKVENFEWTVLSQQKSEKTTVAGIVGIAGVGKTTLAKELFNRHRSNYDGSCCLFDVREHAVQGSLNVLQRKLLKDLAQLDVDISSTHEGVETLKMHLPSSQRVLVVIDDVDHISQLKALVSPIQHTIHSSSLILVTSRSKDPLQTYGILDSCIYQQTGLNRQHSQELFCLHAFHQRYPPTGFDQMVEKYLGVCGGLPLSLQVIGAILYGQYDLHYWDAQLRKISKSLPSDIQRTLKISYDSLDVEEKQLFLDAACFLIGEERDTAIRIWDGSRWQGWLGLWNLENRYMLEVDSENRIRMHDHLRDLGRDIAKTEIPHRFWRSEDIVFDHSPVRGISMVHGTDPEESFEIPTEIPGLELLRAHGTSVERIFNNAQSPQLVWLSWYSCPFSSLPSWISVKKLRVLHIEGEKLETLWQDQSEPPLELRELDIDANILNVPKSIGMLKYLEKFVLRRRKNFGGNTVDLKTLPGEICGMYSLKHLELVGCKNITLLPDSAGNWKSLQRIDLGGCSALQGLPESAGNWTSLRRIDLGGCSALQGLPESAGNWMMLQRIDLGEYSPPQPLPNLAYNWKSKRLPESMGNWRHLKYSPVGSSALLYASSISNYFYDVFINCHPDVKRTFASHLSQRLVSRQLRPFLDEDETHEADNIGTQIKEAIATASVHVVILSLRYAKSRRCLDELLLMLESRAPVIPIFYDLQWTKDIDGVYGRALQNQENRTTYDSQTNEDKPRDNSNTIEEWRKALSNISRLSGFDLPSFNGDEAELVEAVVESVSKSVRKAPFYEVSYLKDLDQMVEDFEKSVLFQRQSGKPRVLGIVGQAGVGKTTLAKELSNRKSSSFNRACILFDVSGTVARSSLRLLQEKLFKCLINMDIQIESVDQGIGLFEKHASSINYGATAFVILDNVDNVGQLRALLRVQNFLPHESLILITSRCEDVLTGSGVEQSSIYHLTDPSLDKHPSCLDRKVTDFADTILSQQQGENPRAVGIVGIGGIGKTRLAMEFFKRKSSDYKTSYFLYDVNETARRSFSLHNLLSKLLQGLTRLDLQVEGVDEGINLFTKHVSSLKSLVILDNVVHWHQLHALLSVLSVLHSDSLILITCREEEVLKCSGVQESSIYKLDRLNPEDSRELFCTHAFGQPSPSQEFEDLANMFVGACNGLPLTLEVFGALLWRKTNSYWQTQFDKLHQIHPDHIEKRLQLCYDDLDEEEKKIFLHIACCCIGEKKDLAVGLWEASGSGGLSVFENLQKRCLVDVDREDCLFMHEYLRELGRSIADEKGLRGRKRPRQSSNERVITELGRSGGDLSQQ